MALLGMKKKQAFGQMFDPMSNGPFGTPGIGDGMGQQMGAPVQGMGQLPDVANMPNMQQPEQQPAKRGPNWLGIIGDSLQILGGGQATYGPQMQEQRQRDQMMRQRALEAQQARETGWQDYVRKATYDRDNKVAEDDPLTVLMRRAGIDPNSERARGMYERAAMNKVDPITGVPFTDAQGNSGLQYVRAGSVGAPQQGAPVFGGWADEEGGPVSQAPGNFPRR